MKPSEFSRAFGSEIPAASHISIITVRGTAVDSADHLSKAQRQNHINSNWSKRLDFRLKAKQFSMKAFTATTCLFVIGEFKNAISKIDRSKMGVGQKHKKKQKQNKQREEKKE